YIVQFTATSTSHTIKFTNWGHISNSHTELILDHVRLFTNAEFSINNFNQKTSTLPFPNPFNNVVTFTNATHSLSEIILYDISSRKYFQQEFIDSISLNTSQLPGGLY